jgi:hypothetical protein
MFQADLRVFHGLPHVCMSGQFLGLDQRGTVPDQPRNVAVPACRVEVRNPLRRLVSAALLLQLLPVPLQRDVNRENARLRRNSLL